MDTYQSILEHLPLYVIEVFELGGVIHHAEETPRCVSDFLNPSVSGVSTSLG